VQTFNPPHQPEINVELANGILSQGKLPLITWKVGPNAWPDEGDNVAQRVVDGEFDAQIRERAAEALQINGPFFSRLFHEMDGAYGQRYDLTPELFREYVSRIHRIFDEEGVTNAVWVWTPAAFEVNPARNIDERAWYPGDEFVDWIGVDPYLWIGDQGADRCRSPRVSYRSLEQAIGDAFWDFAATHPDKPIMLAEWGTGWQADSDIRERFIGSAADAIAAHPQLKALVYVNSSPSAGCDWILTNGTDPAKGLQAYRDLVNRADYDVDVPDLIRSFEG